MVCIHNAAACAGSGGAVCILRYHIMLQGVHLFSRVVSVGVQFYSLSCADQHRAFCVSMLHVRWSHSVCVVQSGC
jgi:hypothetical protein